VSRDYIRLSPPLLVYTGDTHITLLSSFNVNGFVLLSSGRHLLGVSLIRTKPKSVLCIALTVENIREK
jgi:hypothetical protein